MSKILYFCDLHVPLRPLVHEPPIKNPSSRAVFLSCFFTAPFMKVFKKNCCTHIYTWLKMTILAPYVVDIIKKQIFQIWWHP